MTPPLAQPAAGGAGRAASTSDSEGATGPFVINLCSSNTPMALSQPQSAELRRFTFFVSRRLEDRRERFRLHMGYFATLQEAEEWLNVVRGVYPGAWAGETPGKRLREQAAAARTQSPGVPATPAASAPAKSASLPAPAPSARPSVSASQAPRPQAVNVPTLQGAAVMARTAAPVAATRAQPPAPAQRAATAATQAKPPAAAIKPPAAIKPAAAIKAPAKPAAKPTATPPAPSKGAGLAQHSNVREVLAALDETGSTRQMPVVQAASSNANTNASLTDTQVLKILENRRPTTAQRPAEADTGISLLRPDDTGTRQALKAAVVANAPVSFAVQLHWSVQPIDLARVPPLAIFSAYTLYTVEGSREGRRWYGLRLGFFSDAISAKQVAYYVRSEFASVAVIPISTQERDRASNAEERAVFARKNRAATVQDKLPSHSTGEFKLFDETAPAVQTAAPLAAGSAAPKTVPTAPAAAAAAGATKRPPKSTSARSRTREKRAVPSLEETLEILGADQLEIDTGTGELLNDTGVRHLKVSVQKNSPFSRLLERLAERVGKS
jgi:hypothetical protein